MPQCEHGTVEVRRHFTSPPERVFDAWFDKTSLVQWWFQAVDQRTARLEIDHRVQGGYRFSQWIWGEEFIDEATYLEIERPRRLVLEWGSSGQEKTPVRLAVELAPKPDGCEIKLTAESTATDSEQFAIRYNWAVALERLAATLNA